MQACLAPDLDATEQPSAGTRRATPLVRQPGLRLIAAIAQYEEILSTLRTQPPRRIGAHEHAWTLLGSTADRLRVLAALASAAGDDVARQLAATSAHARARFTAAAASTASTSACPRRSNRRRTW